MAMSLQAATALRHVFGGSGGVVIDQVADQTNSNNLFARIDGFDDARHFGTQDQSVLQFNVNDQAGAARSPAQPRIIVEVRSAQDPSYGDGINATSSAVATAPLSQYANQENENTSTITLPNQTVATIDEILIRIRKSNRKTSTNRKGP